MTIKQNVESREQFRDLSAYLQAAREEERKSIAHGEQRLDSSIEIISESENN
jgi:hypothetical protein